MTKVKDKNKNKKNYISHGVVSENRKARFNYEILETLEAGVVLTGTEVKSLRLGKCNIKDAYAVPENMELFLYNSVIHAYLQGANNKSHDPGRKRKLLLHKKQIHKLNAVFNDKNSTIVPLKMYFNDKGRAKILLGIGKGKKLYDKRETIKKRDADRETRRIMKNS
ncbi:MAG: SsrA-binding protein SmpB [Alphaproteobacteria bacterium]|jgi:SsrA-binding protein|nr:SsrA-binding protein SmpB [Alphaproteobacteria bacterium]